MNEILRWVELSRESLPGLIAEGEIPPSVRDVPKPTPNEQDLFVGLSTLDATSRPQLVILNERVAQEVLAWLATYSPASFPITQSMRTLSTEDFEAVSSPTADARRDHEVGYWPCIVLGELLGQGEQFSTIESVALSRASACFSFTQARTEGIYGPMSSLASNCTQRLRTLESDRLFVRRSITVDDLTPIWKFNYTHSPDNSIQGTLSNLVEYVVNGDLSDAPPSMLHRQLHHGFGFDAKALGTGTVEGRVRAYQNLTQSLERGRPAEIAMFLAAAAMCVGNGTSHISLLEEFGRKVPAAYAWFGLFSAVAGPKGWDPSWNRAINSIGRILRHRFAITDPPGFDVSWVEYEFLRGVPKPSDFVRHVPKLFPKSLSVEVAPGATCQLRLVDDSTATRAPSIRQEEVQSRELAIQRETQGGPSPRLAADLYEAERLLSRSQALIRQAIAAADIGVPNQATLFTEPAAKQKRRTSKRNKQPK